MVTRSKKPEADAAVKKASKPKAAAKPKATATKKAAPRGAAKAAPKKTATKKAAPKVAATKTTEVVNIPDVGRVIGEMIYNDELFESMAEIALLGKGEVSPAAMPEIKRQLFDFDIYRVSFLTDEEIGGVAKSLNVPKPLLLTVRDNAKIFVDIAMKYHSVRAFIDRMIEAEGKTHGIDKLKLVFTDELKVREPEHVERFLLLFQGADKLISF
jgi:hypothetical protein